MTAVLAPPLIPTPRVSTEQTTRHTRAIAYQRVLHQALRREFRMLAELASWAPAEDAARAGDLTAHADLLARVLMQHHATEREHLWPALFRSIPAARQDAVRTVVADWTSRAALLDHGLRDLSTVGRQWAVATTPPARDAFARGCARVADAVDGHLAAEEADLLPLLARHLPDHAWTAVRRATRTSLSGREQMLVLGLALEDACAIDRARLLAGLPRSARTAWRVTGRRTFRAAVVRLRGAPPAA
jgi:Hemerythrin HHE cation binding domain